MKNNETQHVESGNSPPTEELEQDIRLAILEHDYHAHDSYKAGVKAGRLLIRLKKEVGHGNWIPALERIGIHERQAQRLMSLATESDKSVGFDSEFKSVRQAERAFVERRRQENERQQAEVVAREQARSEEARKLAPAPKKSSKKSKPVEVPELGDGYLYTIVFDHREHHRTLKLNQMPRIVRTPILKETEKTVVVGGSPMHHLPGFDHTHYRKEEDGSIPGSYYHDLFRTAEAAWDYWHTLIVGNLAVAETEVLRLRNLLDTEGEARKGEVGTVGEVKPALAPPEPEPPKGGKKSGPEPERPEPESPGPIRSVAPGQPRRPEPEPTPAACSVVGVVGGEVTIEASQQGKRGKPKYTAWWNEPDGGSGAYTCSTLEDAMAFVPCSFDSATVKRTVVPGIMVSNPMPRDMCGHAGSYRVLDGKVVPGSEIAPNLYPCEDDEPAPAPESSAMDYVQAREVFGFKKHPTVQEVNAKFRVLARTAHPDAGGSHEAMARLSQARVFLTRKVDAAAWFAAWEKAKPTPAVGASA